MRRVLALLICLGLLSATAGCHLVTGVCDCCDYYGPGGPPPAHLAPIPAAVPPAVQPLPVAPEKVGPPKEGADKGKDADKAKDTDKTPDKE